MVEGRANDTGDNLGKGSIAVCSWFREDKVQEFLKDDSTTRD